MGILWTAYGHGIQDVFAIASYMVALVSVTVGAVQVALVI
jgi:hypothetical protein